MTLNELKTEVAALGFEVGADTGLLIISAANRALAMICSELPIIKTMRAPVCPYAPIYYLAELHHSSGERIDLTLTGTAYSFYVSGYGSFTEISDSGRISHEFNTPFSEYRGRIDGSMRLIFEGDGDFTLLDLSVYDKVLGDGIDGIPTSRDNRILPDKLVNDFSAFTEGPRDSSGKLIEGARIEGREVILPIGYRGVASLKYASRPKKITSDTDDIEISPDAAHILPILTAYFVWLDDEPKLAESYLELYRKLISTAKRKIGARSAEYTDALRWA